MNESKPDTPLDTMLSDNKAAYDRAAKRFLAGKSLLAFILKSVVPEFQHCSLTEIADKYIEGNPVDNVNKIPVDPDLTNAARELLKRPQPANIKGRRNEISSPTEGTNTLDIRTDISEGTSTGSGTCNVIPGKLVRINDGGTYVSYDIYKAQFCHHYFFGFGAYNDTPSGRNVIYP